jgi:hypothetical protein
MNTQILNTYGIKFQIVEEIALASSVIINDFESFLLGKQISTLNYLINELDNALNGTTHISEFESNGRVTLILGMPNSIFVECGSNYSDLSIPTSDVKEILTSYRDWLQTNNYEKYI